MVSDLKYFMHNKILNIKTPYNYFEKFSGYFDFWYLKLIIG